MKQTARIISTYTGDTSGVCSALFELGGMTVMHDASGCNSTYNTHDEPRWYDFDSLVFISALSETEAILGDDDKLIRDTAAAAAELHPRFIALAGTPIPMMTGVDLPGVARRLEQETGLPCFGFDTDGMHSYVSGASQALAAVAARLCDPETEKTPDLSLNLLGLTPLDFSVNGTDRAMVRVLEAGGFRVNGTWAMGCQWEDVRRAGAAQVNLVVSSCGLAAARVLRERFGTPYVVGAPFGTALTDAILADLRASAADGENRVSCGPCPDPETVIVGESVTGLSLANALLRETGRGALVLCATDGEAGLYGPGCIPAIDEDELMPHLARAKRIIADPLYRPICPPGAKFIPLPHEAFSGRIYRKEIPQLVTEFATYRKEIFDK